jgi:hypothetical protein
MLSVCVELHVTVNYVQILSVENNDFMVSLCDRQECKL